MAIKLRNQNPFPPCGGRSGWGVMQRSALDEWRSVERARLSARYPPSTPGLFDPGVG